MPISKSNNCSPVIAGFDPGLARLGYGFITFVAGRPQCLAYGCLETPAGWLDSQRLQKLYQELTRLLKKHQPTIAVVEKLFFAKNTTTALTVAQARGILLLALQQQGTKIQELTPLQVKQYLTGCGTAEKKQIQKTSKILLNLKEIPQPDDAADALALALCANNKLLF